jgi:DNA-binding FadR family transcriptional regulator
MSLDGNSDDDFGDRRPGSRRSRAQQVAADLEARILAERYATGTRLGLRTELIGHYGVSPAVMNEALRILRERNLVEVRPGPSGGVFVANPPPQVRLGGIDVWHQGLMVDPDQLFEARRYLDALFAPVALQRATPEDIRAMEWAVDDMRAARDDARALLNATMRLHMAIARASRIEVLIGLYQTIVATLSATMTQAAFVPHAQELRQHSLELHAGLVNVIRDKDILALEKLLTLHSQDMVRVV